MIKVAVTGAAGRMGSGIVWRITEQVDLEVVAAIEIPNTPLEGKDIGIQAGIDELGVPIVGSEKLEETLKETKPDVLVDFTIAAAAAQTIQTATKCGVNIVVGTTGFSPEQEAANKKAVEDNNVKAVITSNFSIGVNVFFKVIRDLTPILDDYDIEIIEAHHNQKQDAPSGTAMTALETVCDALGRDPEEVAVYGRHGHVGKRTKQEIGVHAIRGGDITGDHTVLYVGDGERLEIKHMAHKREVFIAGVIRAIRYIPDAENGKVSDMTDVLGLN